MKSICLLVVLLSTSCTALEAQSTLQRGTIVRMQMADCLTAEHGFMAALSGSVHAAAEDLCPEYVLVADKVVYVIVGRTSTSLIPLAETTKFRLQKNGLLIRIDDARHESRFEIKEMVLRSEWDHVHPTLMQEVDAPTPHHVDASMVREETH